MHKTTFLVLLIDRGSEFHRFDDMRSFFYVIIMMMMMMMMMMMIIIIIIIIIQASSSWKRNKSKFGP